MCLWMRAVVDQSTSGWQRYWLPDVIDSKFVKHVPGTVGYDSLIFFRKGCVQGCFTLKVHLTGVYNYTLTSVFYSSYLVSYFPQPTWKPDPSTRVHAKWHNRRGFGRGRALRSKIATFRTPDPKTWIVFIRWCWLCKMIQRAWCCLLSELAGPVRCWTWPDATPSWLRW